MVGPWGLEPQTSTVSKRGYQVLTTTYKAVGDCQVLDNTQKSAHLGLEFGLTLGNTAGRQHRVLDRLPHHGRMESKPSAKDVWIITTFETWPFSSFSCRDLPIDISRRRILGSRSLVWAQSPSVRFLQQCRPPASPRCSRLLRPPPSKDGKQQRSPSRIQVVSPEA